MDGNGRWAQRRGLKRTEGHAAGEEALFDTVEGGLEIGLPWMTVYAFSTENWRRPLDEVRFLMRFNESLLLSGATTSTSAACGCGSSAGAAAASPAGCSGTSRTPRRSRAQPADDADVRVQLRRPGRAHRRGAGHRAARSRRSQLDPGKIDERTIARHLYAPDMPDPDLLVRTSGEYRISNYLLWQSAYSEFVFTDVLWPDFRRQHLFDAVREYQRRERRFGAIDDD